MNTPGSRASASLATLKPAGFLPVSRAIPARLSRSRRWHTRAKQKAFSFCLLLFSINGHAAMDRWSALAMLESGSNDRTIGRAGEVSRYQIKPALWSTALARGDNPVNPRAALTVAQAIMNERCAAFERRYRRPPNDFEFYVLWNAPSQLIGPRTRPAVTKVVAARAQRFSNLVGSQVEPVAAREDTGSPQQ